MNRKIIKLENNKEYFQISELNENGITYLLLINVDDESEIKIAKKVLDATGDFIVEVEDETIIRNLKTKFKSFIEEDKKNYV